MRLLNTKTFRLEEVDDQPYAILSHTWGREEVTFQDIQILRAAKLVDLSEEVQIEVARSETEILAKQRTGWQKVVKASQYASKHGFKWIWIDSCCINKDSSAELSEAINSMYRYYLDAAVCYVYLSDVPHGEDPKTFGSAFRRSKWFTRGWTLQELLAPTYLVFLDECWKEIGTKWGLRDAITAITSIPSPVLEDGDVEKYSIAQRMSWAAQRETKRPEDKAYSLMGIFGVSMPPIYGEGDVKAFMRLQQEIIKISEDRSIFAWKASAEEKEDRGLFARSPSEFRESGEVGASAEVQIEKIATFAFNNNGLHIHLPLVSTGDADVFRASLDCQSERDGTHISVYLKKVAAKRYVRYHPWELPLRPEVEKGDLQELIVKENSLPRRPKHPSTSARQCGIKLLPFATSCSVEKSESFWIRFNSQYSAAEEEAACVTYHDIDGTENAVGLLVYPTSGSSNSKNRTFIRSRRNPNQTPRLAFKAISKASYPNMLEEKEEAIPDDWLRNLKADDDRWRGSADRTLTCLENGNGMVALNLHIAAEHSELKPELEAFYFTNSEKIPLPVSTERLVASRKWGWLVSTEIEGLTLERVHPADYFQARHDKQTYISCLDDGDLPASNSRILIYRFNAKGLTDRKAFVAFGFRSLAEPWTDMRVRTISSPKATDDEVEKYERDIEGGNREEYTAIAVHKFAEGVQGDTNTLNVVVGKRENLQLGSHFLRISWSKPSISVDQSD